MSNDGPAVRQLAATVLPEDAGRRLDVWLAERFTYLSRTRWEREIRAGRVILDGRCCRPSALVHAGSEVVRVPPTKPEPAVDFYCEVVFRDRQMLAVNKSGDLPCHPAGAYFRNTLWGWLLQHEEPIHLVNRLDRETSGLVLIGQTAGDAAQLATAFERHQVQKTYLAIVYGRLEQAIHAVGAMGAAADSQIRKKRQFFPGGVDGESAETWIEPISVSDGFSLVAVRPTTGRLHQIRATLLAYGFPIVGDKLYGPDESAYLDLIEGRLGGAERKRLLLPRQALHAWKLRLERYGRPALELEAEMPEDMADFCALHHLRG